VVHCARDQNSASLGGFLLDKTTVMVHTPQDIALHPWTYAVVLGIFHAQVLLPDLSERRMEFVWVRWMDRDPDWVSGPSTQRLERLILVPLADSNATSFIDPATIIRGCHIMPAFCHGRSLGDQSHTSVAHQEDGDWVYYYMNRCVSEFMQVVYLKHAIGLPIGTLSLVTLE
jgi:hypothetical protein